LLAYNLASLILNGMNQTGLTLDIKFFGILILNLMFYQNFATAKATTLEDCNNANYEKIKADKDTTNRIMYIWDDCCKLGDSDACSQKAHTLKLLTDPEYFEANRGKIKPIFKISTEEQATKDKEMAAKNELVSKCMNRDRDACAKLNEATKGEGTKKQEEEKFMCEHKDGPSCFMAGERLLGANKIDEALVYLDKGCELRHQVSCVLAATERKKLKK
jgi:hypothetical protein